MDPQGAHDKQTEKISVVGYGTKTEAAKCPRCSASVPQAGDDPLRIEGRGRRTVSPHDKTTFLTLAGKPPQHPYGTCTDYRA